MKEELIKRLLSKNLAEDIQGCSGFKLGAKSGNRVFNVKKYFYDKYDKRAYNGFINYRNGLAIITNGHDLLFNSEDYSEIYENTRVNFVTGEMQMRVYPEWQSYVGVVGRMTADWIIETDDLLTAINEQVEQYNQAKIDNPYLAKDMKDNHAGFVYFEYPQHFKEWVKGTALNMTQCNLLKCFIEQCKKVGDCAIGVAPFQSGSLKIVGNGMMLISNGCCYNINTEAMISITKKIKPINK